MGLLDKIRDTFVIDESKTTRIEVIFVESRLGMTLEAGPTGEAIVTEGEEKK